MNIRPFRPADLEQVLSVHKISFAELNFDYTANTQFYRKFFSQNRTLVAEIETTIVGFGCYTFFDDTFLIEPTQKDDFNTYINLNADTIPQMHKKLQQLSSDGHVIIEIFPNEFSQTKYIIRDKDMEATSLGILPNFRKQGIGRALLRECEQKAYEHGSSAVFAHCREISHSPALFLSSGYTQIAKLGPLYNDGSAAIIMGKKNIIESFKDSTNQYGVIIHD